jgi:hypothetical protein
VKAWGYVALVVAVIALLGGTYWLGHSRTPPVIEQTINEFTVLDSIPASVQTVHIVAPSGEPIQAEYATMDTTLVSPSGNAAVDLAVGYNEGTNLFNLKANFSETIPELSPVIKKSLIAPIASVGVGFADSLMLHDAELALGVEFAEKYSVSVFGRSDLTYGLRFGVRW